jgi:predicted solute-binding protein
MLEHADAALIIGDAALVLDPADLPFHVLDLGAEWVQMTGLPMVFAVWAARGELPVQDPRPFLDSMRFGLAHIDEIAHSEHAKVGISEELARSYLRDNIVFQLGDREFAGLKTFLQYASELRTPIEGCPVEGRKVSV